MLGSQKREKNREVRTKPHHLHPELKYLCSKSLYLSNNLITRTYLFVRPWKKYVPVLKNTERCL